MILGLAKKEICTTKGQMAVVHRLLSKQVPFQIIFSRSITVLLISFGLQAVKFSGLQTKTFDQIEKLVILPQVIVFQT
jgi:hypothetical protein